MLSLIGIAGILVLKSSDPSRMAAHRRRARSMPIMALVFVSAANFGTAITGIYSSAIGLRNFASLERVSWSTLLLITIAPVALVGVLIPELFFARFGAFLAFLGVAFAPLCGIQIADYFVLRRRQLDIRAIYGRDPAAPYRSIAGFNPAALLALLAGCAVYLALLNPLTYASSGPFRFLTASLPAAAAASLVLHPADPGFLAPVPRRLACFRRERQSRLIACNPAAPRQRS